MIATWPAVPTLLGKRATYRAAAIVCAGCLLGWLPQAHAQAWVPAKGHGSVSLTYQQLKVTQRTTSDGMARSFGKIINRTMYFNVDYGLSDRWAISASIPFKSNRYSGHDPHNPRLRLFPANDQRFLDDGQYHGGWADWSVGLRYQWRTEPLLITPFISYSRPSHDYTFFANAALGTDQWSWQGGVNVGKRLAPPWQNLYWQAGYSYRYMQSVNNRRVNFDRLSLQAGYNFTPRLETHVLIEHQSAYNGLDAPQGLRNPDGSLNVSNLFYHDALFGVSYLRASVGFGYQIGDRYQVYADLGRTLNGDNAHLIDYAATVGISRRF